MTKLLQSFQKCQQEYQLFSSAPLVLRAFSVFSTLVVILVARLGRCVSNSAQTSPLSVSVQRWSCCQWSSFSLELMLQSCGCLRVRSSSKLVLVVTKLISNKTAEVWKDKVTYLIPTKLVLMITISRVAAWAVWRDMGGASQGTSAHPLQAQAPGLKWYFIEYPNQ